MQPVPGRLEAELQMSADVALKCAVLWTREHGDRMLPEPPELPEEETHARAI